MTTWTGKRIYGANVDPSAIGSRQVPQNPAGKAATAPIEVHRHARNGKAPDAWLINEFCEAANQGILYRTKEVFSASGIIGILGGDLPSSTAGDRVRWRFAFHTGVYSRALLASVIQHPQDSGFTANSAARIDIYDNATYAGSPVATATFNYGANPGGTTIVNGLSYMKESKQYLEGLTPDTDYYGVVYDVTNGRTVACSIAEIQSVSDTFAGYLPQNITAESAILDVYRERLASVTYNLWRRSGSTLFNFSIEEPGAIRTASNSTPKNIIDQVSTTYGASIPGFMIDMTGKARLSQYATGVPIRFCAYVVITAGHTGVVCLRNSAGTALVTLTQAGAYTGWVVGTGTIPIGESKYYITHHRSAGAVDWVETNHVSCYEHE